MTRPDFLTVEEVAAMLRRSTKTIRRRIETGAIEATKEGGRYLISQQAFNRYVASLRSPGMDRASHRIPRKVTVAQG